MVILLENTVKFSPEDSEIEIHTNRKGLRVVVSLDRGSDIPEEERRRIFDRFYQMEDAMVQFASSRLTR